MNCDRIARWYQLLEHVAFGNALEGRRKRYLTELALAKRALILGDGDGRFTAAFLQTNKKATADVIDVSPRMLALAQKRITAAHIDSRRVHFRGADARHVALEGKYDLIVTHFFLDCFTPADLQNVVASVSSAATPQTIWLVSEFALPRPAIGRYIAGVLIRIMYLFFRLTTGLHVSRLPDYSAALTQRGFVRAKRSTALGGFLTSELWTRA